jgi:secreted trypsin-like serine protease
MYILIKKHSKCALVVQQTQTDTSLTANNKRSEYDEETICICWASLVSVLVATSVHAGNLCIIDGSKTQLDQFRLIAGLVNNGADATDTFCGACVIAAQLILTAAHCLQDESADNLQVMLNTSDLTNLASAERIQAVEIKVTSASCNFM